MRSLKTELTVLAITGLAALLAWMFVVAGGVFVASRGENATYLYGLASAFWSIAGLTLIIVRAINGFGDEAIKGDNYYHTARQIICSAPLFLLISLFTIGNGGAGLEGQVGGFDGPSVAAGMLSVGIGLVSFWLADDLYQLLQRAKTWRQRRKEVANA